MALISCQRLGIAFGGPPLLEEVGLQVERGERVGLVGRNGEGKSTLLKIIAGVLQPDRGEVVRDSGVRISLLDQQVPEGVEGSTLDVVGGRVAVGGGAGRESDPRLASPPPSEFHHAERLCSLLHLDADQPFAALSGGQKRRALLGRALVTEPDLLLLDEPTNHLDLAHIEQLEELLVRFHGSVLFVTHDRFFLQRVATGIAELDRGRLSSWACDYPTYLERKAALLEEEEKEWAQLDRTLAEEEAWIRRGIKARRTRNEGRVRALEALRRERASRRERIGSVQVSIQEGGRTTSRVVEAKGVSFSFPAPDGGQINILEDFTATLRRGDRVGIIGPNGCGKTTLLNLLIGELEPDRGSIRHGERLEIAYFDQHREQLDPQATVMDAVAEGGEFIEVSGGRRHVNAYLQDFLFGPDVARQPIRSLSGGERNRLLLARLFTRPANVLILDEPTNDLDTETLELLEARLLEFSGTVLIVSHDRAFLDNLCTSTLVFEGGGRVHEYVGGYSDWQRTIAAQEQARVGGGSGGSSTGDGASRGRRGGGGGGRGKPRSDDDRPRRLGFAERREWTALPGRIEELEAELHELQSRLADPGFLQGPADPIRDASRRASEIPAEIERAFERWAELDERA